VRIGTKIYLKSESFAVFKRSRYVTIELWSSRRTAFASPIRVSIHLFLLPSLVHTIPRDLILTYYSVFSLTCRKHCLGCLERYHASIFLVLIFVPARLYAAENRSKVCWKPCWEAPCMQYQFVRKKQMVHPAVPNSDTHVDASVTVCHPIHTDQGSPKFLGEDHVSYCTAVRGTDSCVMCFFRDMFHSTKSTHLS